MDFCENYDDASVVCLRCRSSQELIQFETEMERRRLAGETAVLLCYDIMSLRKINHAYNRETGDAVLAAVADYVSVTAAGAVYRIEGDLYCVIIRSGKLSEAVRLAQKIEKRFHEPWQLDLGGRELVVFIGLALAVLEIDPGGFDGSYADLLERALENSRKSKMVTVFDRETEKMSREHVRLQMDLKRCILQGMTGFDVYFQPIADPISGTWNGVEALCRWNRPGYGMISPFTFIKEAEEMGYIHNVGNWVLERAVMVCKRLGLDRLSSFFVSINLSALQIIRHDFAQTVLKILRRHQYPFDKLLLEITESNEFVINDDTRGTIDLLRDFGIKFALDDFGTGYSSFNSLKHMPVDFLKSEQDFISNIENDSYLQYFLFVLSEVAHSSGKKLIAEGVETREQLDCVIRSGADYIQGYYFGKPLNEEALASSIHHFYRPSDKMRYVPKDYVDFPKWISSKEAYTITPALFSLQMNCMDILLNADTMDDSVNRILEVVGSHFHVKRAYVFLNEEGTIFSNRYEWCAEGVESQMALLQKVDGSLDGFYDIMVRNKIYITTTKSQLPDNLQDRLIAGGQEGSIQSMAVMPMTRKDTVIGFVGFDDNRPRQWTPEEMILLYNLCMLVLIVLGRNDSFSFQDTQETA